MSQIDEIPPFAMPISGFIPEKAVHLCAYFLSRSNRKIDKLKLIKLLYLTEREFFTRYEEPIMWDEFYSLPHGPICSAALNTIDKVIYSSLSDDFFLVWGRQDVQAVRAIDVEELDALSEAEIDAASDVWDEHGGKTASQIRNFTHDFCEEYVEVDRGRVPISYEALLAAVRSDRADEVAHDVASYRSIIAKYA